MGSWEANWDRDVLERIVALLFALARLVDRAAGSDACRRRRVLEIVSHGEAVARGYVTDMVAGSPVSAEAPDLAIDTAHLSIRLRALAMALCLMLMRRFPGTGAAFWQRIQHDPAMGPDHPAAPFAPDTS